MINKEQIHTGIISKEIHLNIILSNALPLGGGGRSELMDRQECAILALELVPKNLIFA